MNIMYTLKSGRITRRFLILSVAVSLLAIAGLLASPVMAAPKTPVTTSIESVAAAPVTIGIPLVAGQNLISLPLIPTDSDINDIFTGISGSVVSVWYYDAVTQTWSTWEPTLGGDLTSMADGRAYFVDMSAPATLNITGNALPNPPSIPPTYAVVTGWNLMGFKETADEPNATYLTGTNYRFPIYGYAAGAYSTITTGAANFVVGAGYWVYFNADGIVTP